MYVKILVYVIKFLSTIKTSLAPLPCHISFAFSYAVYLAAPLLLKLLTEFEITSTISLKYIQNFLANENFSKDW